MEVYAGLDVMTRHAHLCGVMVLGRWLGAVLARPTPQVLAETLGKRCPGG